VGSIPRTWLIIFATSLATLTVTGLVVLFAGRFPWWGSPMAALDWTVGTNLLVGPVAAGIAAMSYADMTASGWLFFLRGTRRAALVALVPAVAVALAAVASLLLLLAVVVVVTRGAGTSAALRGGWIVVPTGIALLAEVMFGAVVGSRLGRWWLAPLAAVAVYAAQAAGAYGTISSILVTGPASTLLVERAFNARFATIQGLALGALAMACAGLLSIRVRAAAGWLVGISTIVSLVGFMAGWLAIGGLGSDGRYTAATGVGLSCVGSLPQVCLSTDTIRPLTALAGEFETQSAPLAAIGLEVPSRFVQLLPESADDYRHDGVVDLQTVEAQSDPHVAPSMVSWSLANPAPCPLFYTGTPRQSALAARVLLADWIARQSNPSSEMSFGTPAETRWLSRSLVEQLAWVKPTYAALAGCNLRGLRRPW
jgi:hypothetical protein